MKTVDQTENWKMGEALGFIKLSASFTASGTTIATRMLPPLPPAADFRA